MTWTSPLPSAVSWITRLVGWAIGGTIIVAMLFGYERFNQARAASDCMEQSQSPTTDSALTRTQQFIACLDKRSDPLGRLLLRPAKRTIAALPNTPCAYHGTWTATRNDAMYKVVLDDDSRFSATPDRNTPPGAQVVSGSWGVVGNRMVWLYDEGLFWPPDINPITNASADAFTLTEVNGATTQYARIEPAKNARCRP